MYKTNKNQLHAAAKLSQAKNTRFQFKKKYIYTFKCLLFALPVHPQTSRCAHGHACARVAHTGTFRQTNVSLAGVKLSCVHVTFTHLKQQKQKHTLQHNTNGIKIGSDDDVVIIPMHLLIYIYLYIYLPKDQGQPQICPWLCVCVF